MTTRRVVRAAKKCPCAAEASWARMPLGDTKELALAEGMNDLAANVLFSAAQSCKRLVPARKMELAPRKALGSTLCSARFRLCCSVEAART